MKEFIRLVTPYPAELIFYVVIAIFILFIINISNIWFYLNGGSLSDIVNSSNIGSNIRDILILIQNSINATLVDFVLWLIIGLISVSCIYLCIFFLKNTNDEYTFLDNIKNPKSRHHEILSFVSGTLVRLVGLLIIIFWIIYFLGNILSLAGSIFIESIFSLNKVYSWGWLLLTIIAVTLFLYILTIALRLILLRIRVFGKVESSL